MKIIKLDASNSTNTFTRELAKKSEIEDYTIVTTNQQTSGRGQQGNVWESDPFKNLTFSVFTSLKRLKIKNQAYLSFAVSLAVYDSLKSLGIPNLSVKWPNDIMSGKKKICGILIENTLLQKRIKNSVVGIGLNVNQETFSDKHPNASSLKIIMKKDFSLEPIMHSMVENIKYRILSIEEGAFNKTHKDYLAILYRKDVESIFNRKNNDSLFTGTITGVSKEGGLQIRIEDKTTVTCRLKEVSLVIP